MAADFPFCSDCFRDDGLRKTAEKIGTYFLAKCPNCHSNNGAKITKNKVEKLVTEFFWDGSFFRSEFGGASRIVSNPYRYQDSDVTFPPWLVEDAELIQEKLKIGFLHYGPPLWRLGEIEPLKQLHDTKTREAAALALVDEYPDCIIDQSFSFTGCEHKWQKARRLFPSNMIHHRTSFWVPDGLMTSICLFSMDLMTLKFVFMNAG